MSLEKAVDVIGEKIKKHSIVHLSTNALSEKMKDFRLHIVVIGAFSAGKSAMLNTLIGDELLSEGQRPETALASELIYDTEEYVEAFRGDAVQRMSIEDAKAKSRNGMDCDYLRWHLNRPGLELLHDYTLVDMPGFNSGIEAHNKAIFRYVTRANAYILVIDVHDGGIKKSQSDFMKEIRQYQGNLAIAVSKTDLVAPENLEEVLHNIQSMASRLFGEDITVIPVSKKDPSRVKPLTDTILQLDRDAIYRQCFAPDVKSLGDQVIDVLEEKKRGLSLNQADLNKQISKLEKEKKNIELQLRRETERLRATVGSRSQQAILNDVQAALEEKASTLAASLKRGGASLNAQINAIVRPVLLTST